MLSPNVKPEDYPKELPPEIEAQMPEGLSIADKFQWRLRKIKELAEQQAAERDVKSNSETDLPAEPAAAVSEPSEPSEPEPETPSEPDEPSELSSESIMEVEVKKEVSQTKKTVSKKNDKGGSSNINSKLPKPLNSDYELVKYVPKSVMSAIRKLFPESASRADLISAFVYIHTGGDCEISEAAMKIVKTYEKEDNFTAVNERLANIERILRRQTKTMQAVELCTCYNTFDRRYGSKERRVSPKDTEFREQGNLDMLARLRRQAEDQRQMDDIERGRQIYDQIKDKND